MKKKESDLLEEFLKRPDVRKSIEAFAKKLSVEIN